MMEEPTTPSSLRWTPAKRPVTVERQRARHASELGSPLRNKENSLGVRQLKVLAPPPPLLPMAPTGTRALTKKNKNQVAERLRQRLQFAYYKVRTQQQDRPLQDVTAPLCI